jgi:hypothetical protein
LEIIITNTLTCFISLSSRSGLCDLRNYKKGCGEEAIVFFSYFEADKLSYLPDKRNKINSEGVLTFNFCVMPDNALLILSKIFFALGTLESPV